MEHLKRSKENPQIQGYSSATFPECVGPELEALEGQEGLGAVAVQEALDGPVSMTPESM